MILTMYDILQFNIFHSYRYNIMIYLSLIYYIYIAYISAIVHHEALPYVSLSMDRFISD